MSGRNERTFTPDFLTELFRNPLDPGYADAALRRNQGEVRIGWWRSGTRMVSLFTVLVLGVLLAVAYRQTVADEPGRSSARAGLVDQIKQRQAESERLAGQAGRLRDEVARQRDAALTDSAAARLRNLEAIAGLARVRGDGVEVRVADGPAETDAVTGAGGSIEGRVLDRDLQEISNALWNAGAEAIAINGQRLTSTSTIRRAGGAILVDFKPVIGPYQVSAIGPDGMERGFRASRIALVLRDVAAKHGMEFSVHDVTNLVLPAAAEPQLRYARTEPAPTPSVSGQTSDPEQVGAGSSPRPPGGGR